MVIYFSLVNQCYQQCVICLLGKGKPCWVISGAVMKPLLARIIDAHLGSSSAGLQSADFALSFEVLINFQLDA